MNYKQWKARNEMLEYDPTHEEVWNAAIRAALRICSQVELDHFYAVGDPRLNKPILPITDAIRRECL